MSLKNIPSEIILIIAVLVITIVVLAPSLQNPRTALTTIQSIIITIVLVTVAILVILRRGVLPQMLITNYLPFPLVLLKMHNSPLSNIREYVLSAVEETIALVNGSIDNRPYRIMKNILEFFTTELGHRPQYINKLGEKLKEEIYYHIPNNKEKTSAAYSLASLIIWIFNYRNLTFHYPRKDPDPIDAWFALRTLLIYIKEKYRITKAILYTKCPKCGCTNQIILYEGQTHWLKELSITCENKNCGYEYKIKLTPHTIREHYKLKPEGPTY